MLVAAVILIELLVVPPVILALLLRDPARAAGTAVAPQLVNELGTIERDAREGSPAPRSGADGV